MARKCHFGWWLLSTQETLAVQHLSNLFDAGSAAYEQGDYSSALHYFELARVKDDGTNTAALLGWIGVCQYKLENYAAARSAFESELEITPKSADTLMWWASSVRKQAIAAFETQDYRTATEYFRSILERIGIDEAMHKGTLLWFGISYQLLEEYSKAIETFEEVLTLAPDTHLANEYLCYILATSPNARIRDGRRAKQIADNLLANTKNEDWGYMTLQAAARAEMGDFEKAITVYKKAMALMPSEERHMTRLAPAAATTRAYPL